MTDRRVHPYQGIEDHRLWSRAVTWAPPGELDPVTEARFRIGPDDAVATMGSCFAQHVARSLAASGLNYLVTETAPDELDAAAATARQYGLFSARYGNVYTVEQALQLVRRAMGEFEPAEDWWPRGDVVVDPFRPLVEPDGFADVDALRADRASHLAATRAVIERTDVLVFTLGLTEGWRSRRDGALFPTAPGVNGGSFDAELHEFVNFDVDAVRSGLLELCRRVREINPGIRVLLTVSPVPLIATAEHRHVLVSTSVSKAILRVAADETRRALDFVDYFPSYELISTVGIRNYYEPDLREVRPEGVAHVMRVFHRHYVDGGAGRDSSQRVAPPPALATAGTGPQDVVCDEETILAAIEATR
ncbi:MAG: GSCFA domain-containing protein [Acidimicrobiales bacterium]